MISEARTFLDALFARCDPESILTLTALPPIVSLPTPSRHLPLRDVALLSNALERLEMANENGWSGLVGIGTRRANLGRWRRGGKNDLVALPALFVDIDTLKGVEKRITRCPVQPSCIVSSGHGLHLYFYLREPTQDWRQATRVLCGLATYFKGDSAVSVAQSMRLPGTLNHKSGRESVPCCILDHYPERRYMLNDFSMFIQGNGKSRYRTPSHNYLFESDCNRVAIGDPNPALIQDVTQNLIAAYGGRMQANGWLAAYCPCGHRRDGVGAHFGFNPAWGMGVCFGRHGRLRLIDLCPLLGIDPNCYGWVIRKSVA